MSQLTTDVISVDSDSAVELFTSEDERDQEGVEDYMVSFRDKASSHEAEVELKMEQTVTFHEMKCSTKVVAFFRGQCKFNLLHVHCMEHEGQRYISLQEVLTMNVARLNNVSKWVQ